MDERPILTILQDESHIERVESKALRHEAINVIEIYEGLPRNTAEKPNQLPSTLYELLTRVIKPLFSAKPHPQLTATGRKVLVRNSIPASVDQFSSFDYETDENRPLWKNGWTSQLLLYVANSYRDIEDSSTLKKLIEAHFYLTVPPILKQLDDVDISHKRNGCHCLRVFCDNLSMASSDILEKSGMIDIFIDALKNDFSLLPTLTPECESLELYRALYPAYRSLVEAWAAGEKPSMQSQHENAIGELDPRSVREERRLSYLTVLLRHQLLHGLAHLSTGSGAGSSVSISLSAFLISQLGWIFTDMGLQAVVHLQNILPLLRSILSDPFNTASPETLVESAKAMQSIIQICWPRVQDRWWAECLKGVIACWLNISDEQIDVIQDKDKKRAEGLKNVKNQLQMTVHLLHDIVGQPFAEATHRLSDDDADLLELFDEPPG